MQQSIEALGHTICNHTITASKKKTAAVRDIAPPNANKQLASAMGTLGLARRFMPDFGTSTLPLCQLLAMDHRKFSWLPKHQAAMDLIKRRFEAADALAAPNFDLPFEVHCDASAYAAGAILTQHDPTTGISAIAEFFGTQFNSAEKNYTVCERECLATAFACKRWRPCLLARNDMTIALRTDHAGLTWAHRSSDINSRPFRWVQQLAEFNCSIQWQPGSTMQVPDALSRVKVTFSPRPSS